MKLKGSFFLEPKLLDVSSILSRAPLFLGALIIPLLRTELIFDNFTYIKWFGVYVVALLATCGLLSHKNIPVPKLPVWCWCFLGFAVAIFAAHLFCAQTSVVSFSVVDRISLIALCFYFFTFFRQQNNGLQLLFMPTLLATVATIAWGSYQIFVSGIGDDYSASFGNTNMAGQFLGFSIIIQSFISPSGKKSKWFEGLRFAIFFLSISYMTILMCRSIFLGLIICYPLLFLKKPKRRVFILTAAILAAILFGLFVRSHRVQVFQRAKQFALYNPTSQQRLNLYKQSLRIIRDHPLGIGPGAYEFGSIPYAMNTDLPPREDQIFRSPHNEVLRFSVEDGIPYVLLMTAVIIFIFASVILPTARISEDSIFFIAFGIIWLFETLFQFPFENAYPAFLFTVVAGSALSKNGESDCHFPLIAKALATAALIAISFLGSRIIYSKYLEANSGGNMAGYQRSCDAFADNWRACLTFAKGKIEQHDWQSADLLIRSVLNKTPYNFSAIRIWSVLAFRSKHFDEGCYAEWIYDQIFSEHSGLHGNLLSLCPEESEKLAKIGMSNLYPKPLPNLFSN